MWHERCIQRSRSTVPRCRRDCLLADPRPPRARAQHTHTHPRCAVLRCSQFHTQVRAGIKFASVTDYVPNCGGDEAAEAAAAVESQARATKTGGSALSRFRMAGKTVIAANRGTGIGSILNSGIGVGFNVAPATANLASRSPTQI